MFEGLSRTTRISWNTGTIYCFTAYAYALLLFVQLWNRSCIFRAHLALLAKLEGKDPQDSRVKRWVYCMHSIMYHTKIQIDSVLSFKGQWWCARFSRTSWTPRLIRLARANGSNNINNPTSFTFEPFYSMMRSQLLVFAIKGSSRHRGSSRKRRKTRASGMLISRFYRYKGLVEGWIGASFLFAAVLDRLSSFYLYLLSDCLFSCQGELGPPGPAGPRGMPVSSTFRVFHCLIRPSCCVLHTKKSLGRFKFNK